MPFLYSRQEDNEKVTIVFKYQSLILLSVIALLIISVLKPFLAVLIFPILFLLILVQLISYWKPRREISKAKKTGAVRVSGSQYSFKNPLTIIIEKNKF